MGEAMKGYGVREKIAALFCLTVLAIVAMVKLDDPTNVVTNIVVGICAFITGSSSSKRRDDDIK
jgi:hypothetical protein